jgi:hypothetical protein
MPRWSRKYLFSVSFKLLVFSNIVLLGTLCGLLLRISPTLRTQVARRLQGELQGIANTAAIQLDGDKIKTIRTNADAKSPAFLSQRAILAKVRDANHLTPDQIYTFYRDGDDLVRFGVMTQDPFIGSTYKLRPEMRPVFDRGVPNYTDLYTDENDSWITAYAPIRDSSGKVVAILDVDQRATEFVKEYHMRLWELFATGVVAAALSSIFGWIVLHRVVIRPMGAVREGMLALGRRQFTHRVKLRTRDEFQDLGETLNHIAKELDVARAVQSGFNPTMLPKQSGYAMAAASEPCEATAGDYFDAFSLDENRIAVLVADVTGHGLGPSLLMSACRSALRALSTADLQPQQILARLDALLQKDLQDGRFITMIFGVLEADGQFVYSNAGHAPAMVSTDAGVHHFEAHRPPLGIDIDLAGEDLQSTIQLEPGDRVLLASDGVIEAMNADGEQFGSERLEAIVSDRSLTYEQVVERIQRELNAHCGGPRRNDDVTILCIDRITSPAFVA